MAAGGAGSSTLENGRPLGFTAGAPATHGQWVDAFVQRLHELGWVEGRTIAIEYRWAEGHSDRYAKIAADFSLPPGEILFLSDVVAELDAAKEAGMQTGLVVRPGNAPVTAGHAHQELRSFAEIRRAL